MGTTLHWPALVTLATLLLLFGCVWLVSAARGRHKVRAPATTGPEEFERAYRVQMNTLENAVIFLPALWLASPRRSERCGSWPASGTPSPTRATRATAPRHFSWPTWPGAR